MSDAQVATETTSIRPVTPTETGGGIGATAPSVATETTGNGAELAKTLGEVMAAHPDSSRDTLAALAGKTPVDIPPVVDPARATTEPTPKATTEDATQTPEDVTPPLFRFVEQAQLALDEAVARGASQEDIDNLSFKLSRALLKDQTLNSGLNIIQIDREIAEAKKNGASNEELAALASKRAEAISARKDLYEKIFTDIKRRANTGKYKRPFAELVDEILLEDAVSIHNDLKLSLKETEKDPKANPTDLENARLRLQASEMHLGIIKKKREKVLSN